MATVGLVGSGAMGSAIGAGWIAGGTRVVTAVGGRSERTRERADTAGLECVGDLADVVAESDLIASVVPPGVAVEVAREIAEAAGRLDKQVAVVDFNAIAPATLRVVRDSLAAAGCDLTDASISGGPPRPDSSVRVYVAGPRAGDLCAIANPRLDIVRLTGPVGAASALKMCTASMYKGTHALVMQALLTAHANGVADEFLADTARHWPDAVAGWPAAVAVAATKAWRFVDEMDEIALTQAEAGLPAELFQGVAAAYARARATPLGELTPEQVDRAITVEELVRGLAGHSIQPE